MADWYARTGEKTPAFSVYSIGLKTEDYAKVVGLSDTHVRIMLCMWHEESRFQPGLSGDRGCSFGTCQTPKKYFRRLRKFWLVRGVHLGPTSTLDTQIAFGVAEFYEHWQYTAKSHNRLFETVRGYNGGANGGSGLARARRYARKVFKTYRKVFHPARPR